MTIILDDSLKSEQNAKGRGVSPECVATKSDKDPFVLNPYPVNTYGDRGRPRFT